MIFSYLDYVSESYEYSIKGSIKDIKVKNIVLPKEYKIFFRERGICPSCKTKTKIVYSKPTSMTFGKDFYTSRNVWECEECGWWETLVHDIEECDLIEEVDSYNIKNLNHAIVKRFEETDKSLPLKVLLDELKKNKDILYDIHYYKMEELAQYVFSQFYDCEVKHVGKTGDGGKDLIIINKDKPILVQVKRRTKKDSTESVSTIRDFLGTMFIEKSRRGIIVSTAEHFTKPSAEIRDELIKEKRLDLFELYDFDRFCESLEVYNNSNKKAWYKIVEDWD
ncbi:hypothetical protein N452_04100 [Clostridium botulinum A2 117]|uniref:restriction endonuclease n=1 Tax=Clostridium botulinum TaxID=1491 RepID=UPI0007DF058A|nr:restriction endonuclease [Clostridium botulinum]KEI77824.1 hypothetical protein N452_04100 [Clostridium botulinum A2 117]MBN3414997.1 restriction endonuclease [Clostridium botulinum]MBN3441290.1 restriction endonuclease [Clostridium botulinum]MBY6805357.1 restriction endonuclease [Clostridium botulinum]